MHTYVNTQINANWGIRCLLLPAAIQIDFSNREQLDVASFLTVCPGRTWGHSAMFPSAARITTGKLPDRVRGYRDS